MSECFECHKKTKHGEIIQIYAGRDEFFCNECAMRLFG